MGRPWIADPTLEALIGGLVAVAGFALLWDAYEGRGRRKPAILGPFLPW